jgi:hypothetical protein
MYGLGVVIIFLAVVTHIWSLDLGEVFDWLETAFGPVYLVSYVALVAVAVYAATRLSDIHQGAVWLEAGQQAAAGIATLALTFTLLGISLGIESLSNHAFLTTIVGLPTANGLRALLSIRWAALREQPQNQTASCRVPV